MKVYLFLLINLFMLSFAFASIDMEDRGLEDNLTFHVFDDVDLISTLKFDYGKPKIVIKSVYPQLASETEREGVNQFNLIALGIVKDKIARFRAKVKETTAIQNTLAKEQISNRLYIDYNTSFIKSKQNHIISIRFSVQGSIAGNVGHYREYTVLNYNLDKNQQIQLADLFQENADFLEKLSEYSKEILLKRLANKSKILLGTAPTAENFGNWNIKPSGLVITFKEDQVAPAIYGTQTVIVPYAVLKNLLSQQSPLADCIKNNIRCSRTNVNTGGFIDEANNNKHISSQLV